MRVRVCVCVCVCVCVIAPQTLRMEGSGLYSPSSISVGSGAPRCMCVLRVHVCVRVCVFACDGVRVGV